MNRGLTRAALLGVGSLFLVWLGLHSAAHSRATAALLGLNPRTLQRRLASAGASFDEIREDVYRTAAMHYLCETQMPLGQVAAALGYSEQSAFTRACRRWFGATPSTVRATTGGR